MIMTQKKPKTKIGHSLEELEDGLILTIQDKPVLQNGEINQQDDVLVNYQKRVQNEAEHNRELKQKLKTIANAATSHLQAKNEGMKGLLPHYDDHKYKSDEIQIEDGITFKRNRPKVPKNVANDFQPQQNINTQYYDRTTKFKQRKKQQSKSSTADLLSFLNQTAVQKQLPKQDQKNSAEDLIEQSLNTVRKRKKLQNEHITRQSTFVTNQDQQLLNRAIKIGRKKHIQENKLLNIIKEEAQDENEQQAKQDNKCTVIQMNPVTYKQTSSSQQTKKIYNITDAAKGTASCLFVNLPSQKIVVKKQQEPMYSSFNDITEEQLEKMKQQVSFLQQKSAGIGLAGTLNFLRQNNLINKQEQFGRANDKQSNHNQPGDRIKLQYRNASGKLMKPKEAFRYMSAIFHGQGPGKNKIEKIKKKQLLEMRIKQAASGPSKLMTLLDKHQGKTGEAHMVIQLGAKKKEQ